jgi:hypothetical protein
MKPNGNAGVPKAKATDADTTAPTSRRQQFILENNLASLRVLDILERVDRDQRAAGAAQPVVATTQASVSRTTKTPANERGKVA